MRSIPVLALAWLGVSAALLTAQTTSNSPPTLDVVVEDGRGRAVDTLNTADFSVTEQSRPVAVDSVRFVRGGGRTADALVVPVSAAAKAPAPAAGGVIAIYLDEFHVTPGPAAERARSALIRFVNTDIGSADQLIVLKSLDSLLEIKPTGDRAEAVQKIEAFDPRRGEYQPRTAFERNFIAGTPARVEIARAQIATSSLEALATELGRLGGARKTLIVVSEGFTRSGRRRGEDLLPSLDSVVLAANRGHVAIYPFEPIEDQGAKSDTSTGDDSDTVKWREALQSLADGTSGRTINAASDPAALASAFNDSRGYYELTLSKDLPHDGRFHAVDISVRRPGLTSRARKGYWALSDTEPSWRTSLTGIAPLPATATMARRVSPLIRPWFGISKAADGETQISFVWEPAPRVPGDRNPPPALAQVGLSVMKLDGSPVFQATVLPSTNALADAPASGQSRASFVTPSGRLVVQMSIEDVTSRVVDHDVRDLEVKGFPGPVSLGSPEVLRAHNAREYKVLAADPDATPVAGRQFSRTERLIVRVPVFTTGATPAVSARLLSSFGTAMRDLTVTQTSSRSSDYQVEVPLAALANGSYVVEWTARTADGEVKDRVAFRVTS